LNLLHTVTAEGFDSGLMMRGTARGVMFLLFMLLIRSLARRFQMPEVSAWGKGGITVPNNGYLERLI